MSPRPPEPTRSYRNHHLDSARWQGFVPRDDDIIVSTAYKSGTTWMQQILHRIILRDAPDALPVGLVSPWLDARFHGPVGETLAGLEAQEHRRFVKSHVAFDGLPYFPKVKYVVVGRDPRDVFMSLWNHYRNYTDEIMARLNDAERPGDRMPEWPGEDALRDSWRAWIGRGWFSWEEEGWPFWGNLRHTRTFWEHRELDNLLLVHYGDLLADCPGQIRRLADFLDISLRDDEVERVAHEVSFPEMKKSFRAMDPMLRQAFKGGSDSFIHKGTNGRWRGVLDDEDLALYRETRDRVLSPDCAAWLERD